MDRTNGNVAPPSYWLARWYWTLNFLDVVVVPVDLSDIGRDAAISGTISSVGGMVRGHWKYYPVQDFCLSGSRRYIRRLSFFRTSVSGGGLAACGRLLS